MYVRLLFFNLMPTCKYSLVVASVNDQRFQGLKLVIFCNTEYVHESPLNKNLFPINFYLFQLHTIILNYNLFLLFQSTICGRPLKNG